MTLKSLGNVTINGMLSLTGKGYGGSDQRTGIAGYGPGSPGLTLSEGCGGSYGGAGGGQGANCSVGSTYIFDDSGSAGGGSSSGYTGGPGGGGLIISSLGSVSINSGGKIYSVGGTGQLSSGAGSGGLIKLIGLSVINSGTLSVSGGVAGSSTGGGGGAGRVVLIYKNAVSNGTILMNGGLNSISTATNQGGNFSPLTSRQTPLVYSLGGINSSGIIQTAINQALIDPSIGVPGAFGASANPLLTALKNMSTNILTVGTSAFMYVIGGNNGSNDISNIYKINIDAVSVLGTLGAGTTANQVQLPMSLSQQASVISQIGTTNYIWIIGGNSGGIAQNTIYKGIFDSSGNIISLTSSGQASLPTPLAGLSTAFKTINGRNYLLIIGGNSVYKAKLDSNGNVIEVTTNGNTQLSNSLTGQGTAVFTDNSSNNYLYTFGGTNNGSPTSAIAKALINSDQTGYKITRQDFAPLDLSNKNAITFWTSSDMVGSFLGMDVNIGTSASPIWQSCSFGGSSNLMVNSTNIWEKKYCNISAITPRTAVTGVRIKVSTNQIADFSVNVDDMNATANTYTGTVASAGSAGAVLGAADITVNSQGSGAVRINYDPTNLAGTGGLVVYNGGTNPIFSVVGNGGTTTMTINGLPAGAGTNLVIDANGRVYMANSSERYKENVQPLVDDFSKVLGLQPKTYNYTATGQKDIGYIAEELDMAGLKDLVNYDSQGRPDSIKYDKLSLYIIEMLKRQQTSIDSFGQAATVSGLTVLGNTNLADAFVTGKLSVGLLDIIGTDKDGGASINTVIGSIQFMNQKLEIDQQGNFYIKDGLLFGNDLFRGTELVQAGQNEVTVMRQWNKVPITVIPVAGYNSTVWVEDLGTTGFIIKLGTSPQSDSKVYWNAMW